MALADGREFPAKVILKDEHSDLAVLRLDAEGVAFPSIEFSDSDSLEVGDLVLAIGDPFGVGQTVTSGIVSALARTQVGISDYQFFIQTDAAINPGNSGGALVDMDGRLVGINTAIFSKSGGSHGIGFAIPSNLVRLVVQSALKGGKVQRPWLGASLQTLTPDIADSLGLDAPSGALVAKVHAKGPAAKAGLRAGDVVVSVDDKAVQNPQGFQYRFLTKGVGGSAELGVRAQGASRSRPPSPWSRRSRTRRAMRAISPAAIRSPAARSPICRPPSPRRSAWTTTRARAWWCSRSRTDPPPRGSASGAATSWWPSTTRRSLRSTSWPAFWRSPPAPGGFRSSAGERCSVSPSRADAMKKAAVTLFEAAGLADSAPRPLADRLRPASLAEVIGQDHLLGEQGMLSRMVKAGRLVSVIFWGPPGTGKTTVARLLAEVTDLHFEQLSAIHSGVSDLRKVFDAAKARREEGRGTLLFVDEIHRFNRSQQDAFLPHMEDGTIILVGATTENPSFELNSALLSRASVLDLQAARRRGDRGAAAARRGA